MSERQTEDLSTSIEALISHTRSLEMATVDTQGLPDISYTPFIYHEQHFYLLISALAPHTSNLKNNPKLSVMLIEDESQCSNIFARTRLTLNCHANFIARDATGWETCVEEFEARHGKTAALLRTLPDFSLVKCALAEGRFIRGFGQAYSFCGTEFHKAILQEGK